MKQKSFFETWVMVGDFAVWQSILSVKDLIFKGSCFKVKDGFDIKCQIETLVRKDSLEGQA